MFIDVARATDIDVNTDTEVGATDIDTTPQYAVDDGFPNPSIATCLGPLITNELSFLAHQCRGTCGLSTQPEDPTADPKHNNTHMRIGQLGNIITNTVA